MIKFLHKFLHGTSGAVTVDWVVLTAAVVGIGIAAAVSVAQGAIGMSENIDTFLQTEGTFIQNE